MSKARTLVIYWLPILLWMAVIFSASSDRNSFEHSSRIVAPFLRWLLPHISEQAVEWGVLVVRKAAHLTEYAILAVLVWRLMARLSPRPKEVWRWPNAGRTLLVVLLYAASDEFHQSFVPSRQASVWDVLLDTTGGFLALILIWVIGRWRHRW